MMKTLLLITFSFLTLVASALTGGPDAYGYTWEDSAEPSVTYNWVDITGTGTLVSGIADDNSVGPFSMGMSFHYYWGDYNQIKIGSNGWLGFENTSNIASCFPNIPAAGGAGDNYLAPLMADWNFDGVGNASQVYYEYDAVGDRFIVSYINVSRWIATAPNYLGSSSFQVILNNSDSSIVFQYQAMDPVINSGCVVNNVVGIEGPTGAYGLENMNNTVPANSYAIKYTYPNPVLLSIPDIKANWNVNMQNGGDFRYIGNNVDVPINVASVGNVDVITPVIVITEIRDQALTLIASNSYTLTAGLNLGADSTTQFLWTPLVAGQYSVTTTVTNASDINSTNNVLTTEFEIIDPLLASSRYNYVNATDMNTGTVSWSGGGGGDDGAAVLIIPNDYPFVMESVGTFVTGIAEDLTFEVYDDDGIGGAPGTLLYQATIPAGSVTTGAWNTSTLLTPLIMTSGGVYVTWIQFGANMQLGTNNTGPMSNRGYEYLSGSFAEYRDNSNQDLMIEANGFSACASFQLVIDNVQGVDCFGDSNGAVDITVSGGTPGPGYIFNWSGGIGAVEDPTGMSPGGYTLVVTDDLGCTRTDSITITEPALLTITVDAVNNISCFGLSDGSIDLTVNGGTPGVGGYTYSWTNGAGAVEDPTGLSANDYVVTVTDDNGCTAMDSATIIEPPLLVLSATSTDEIVGADGTIDLTVVGGTSPYTFSWTNGAGVVEDPTGLTAGDYTVTVTDSSGCIQTLLVTVLSQVGIDELYAQNQWSIFPNPSNGVFTVAVELELEATKIEIIDALGRRVYLNNSEELSTISIQSSGVYYVVLHTTSGKSVKKIVVQ
ncbi:MAG: hypothetical protein ACI837_002879 [Crocinitomicaceae bacterium]|jgi:hypothetical protein